MGHRRIWDCTPYLDIESLPMSDKPPPLQRRSNSSLHTHHVTKPHKMMIRGRILVDIDASLFEVNADPSVVGNDDKIPQ